MAKKKGGRGVQRAPPPCFKGLLFSNMKPLEVKPYCEKLISYFTIDFIIVAEKNDSQKVQ